MEIVRIYYNSIDIQPRLILHHFLRYLGLYVEEVTEGMHSRGESLVDIYIVGDEYMWEKMNLLK